MFIASGGGVWCNFLMTILVFCDTCPGCCVDLERRDLSHKEKLYLREQNVITETQCTLGKSTILDTKYSNTAKV